MQDKFIRLPEVIATTGRGRATIYADIKAGRFPQPRKIGLRAVGWLESDLQQWASNRPIATMGVNPAVAKVGAA